MQQLQPQFNNSHLLSSAVRFLLKHGASVTSTTKHGYTALHQAAQQVQRPRLNILTFLISFADHLYFNISFVINLLTSYQGHVNIVDLLVASGASPDALAKNGQTAFSIAERLG